ncbi:MAG: hypothetical protein DWH82_10445 [Planctomycetota bacterium]|nr:MAG: hypothetical protein DWH82_10445 [Planctomycetota bacterium]
MVEKNAGSWSFASRSLMVCMGEIGAVSHHFPLAGAGTGSSGGILNPFDIGRAGVKMEAIK